MSFDFTETFDIALPNVESDLAPFAESEFKANHGLVIEVAAIHAGITANYNNYSAEELEKSVNSWVTPYPKPIIMNHDMYSEPVGRIQGARMEKEDDGTPYVRLQAAVLDPEAIQKVADGRYLTGSVGGKAEEALCSICGKDWAKASFAQGLPCKHKRGNVYGGKLAMLEMKGIGFKEYSFVNAPADSKSSVRKIVVGESEADELDEWARPVRFFAFDMDKEDIVEFTESENVDVLSGMRKKVATPLYLGLKGAFLSALAIEECENEEDINTNIEDAEKSNQENSMANKLDENDVLAVMEELNAEVDNSVVEDGVEDSVEESDDSEDTTVEEAQDEVSEDSPEAEVEESEEVEEASEETDEVTESNDEDDTTELTEEESEVSDAADELQESNSEDDVTESDENPELEALASRVEELEQENDKLRSLLHRTLAERVVDAKIAHGVVEADTRKAAIEEHIGRTASSLADSLKDLASLKPTNVRENNDFVLENRSNVVGSEKGVTTIDEEDLSSSVEVTEEQDPQISEEDFFVDVFLGRKQL